MSTGAPPVAGEIYPAYCFSRAPTHQKWVKLTTADIQLLRQEPGFEGQNIWFYLNHPIEHIYIVGPVVAIDHIVTQYNTQIFTLEIDDGSGCTMEVKINTNMEGRQSRLQIAGGKDTTTRDTDSDDSSASSSSDDSVPLKQSSSTSKSKTLTTRTFPTIVDGLVITLSPAGLTLTLHNTPIEVGTVLKAKGTLTKFRNAFQLTLLRAFIVRTLAEEIDAWEEYAAFAASVLSRPWILSASDRREIEIERKEQASEERRKARKAKEVEKLRAEWEGRMQEKRERRERRRVKEEKIMDGNALDRPGWRPYVPPPGEEALTQPIRGEEKKRVTSGQRGSYLRVVDDGRLPGTPTSAQPLRRTSCREDGAVDRTAQFVSSAAVARERALMPPPPPRIQATPRFVRPTVSAPMDAAWRHEKKSFASADGEAGGERVRRPYKPPSRVADRSCER